MRPLLSPSAYTDPAVFEGEREAIFRRTWQYVGLERAVAGHQDYLCADVGGRSVVVQNFHGTLRAFHNVCTHRHSRLRADACGSGPLRCPYHGWTFNGEGLPVGIPGRAGFPDLDDQALTDLSLRRYQVARCGALVFVRLGDGGPGLAESLGGHYDELRAMSLGLGERIGGASLQVRANWKIVVENTLEDYHVTAVHGRTIKKYGMSEADFRYAGPHSAWRAAVDAAQLPRKLVCAAFAGRPYQTDRYVHHLVFPNLTFSTHLGMTYALAWWKPVSPAQTLLELSIFESRLGQVTKEQEALVRLLRPLEVAEAQAVFAEDQGVCELVQAGVAESPCGGILAPQEERVHAFQRACLEHLGGPSVS